MCAALCLQGCVAVVFPVPVGPAEEGPVIIDDGDDGGAAIATGVAVTLALAAVTAIIVARVRSNERDDASRPAEPRDTVDDRAGLAVDADAKALYARGYVAASRGDCVLASEIGDELARTSRPFHARYVIEPTIAACAR